MASTRLGYLAVKKETTTAVAVKPVNFIRYKDGDIMPMQEIIHNNPIQNNRWNALNAVEGKMTVEGEFNLDLDYNECVHFLAAGLGAVNSEDISSEDDSSAFRHTITFANTIPSLSIEQAKGNIDDTTGHRQKYTVERSFGVMVDSFTMAGSDGIVSLAVALKGHGIMQKRDLVSDAAAGSSVAIALKSIEGLVAADNVNISDTTPQSEVDAIASISTGNKTITIATLANSYTVANKAKVELTPQSASYPTLAKVCSFVHASFQFGADLTAAASAAEENIEDWEFTFENKLQERFGSLRNSPSVIAPTGARAGLTFTKYFETVEDRDRYLNIVGRACILTLTDHEIISATDTNNAKFEIKVEMSSVIFSTYEMPTATDDLYAVSVEAELYYDPTDARALRILVQNEEAGTLYA